MNLTTRNHAPVIVTALVLVVSSAFTTGAFAYSSKVKTACAGDYQSFCAQYLPESTEARRCFESNRKQLTKQCVTALVDAGEVPARYLKR